MKNFITLVFLLTSLPLFANQLVCEAWYKQGSSNFQEQQMNVVKDTDNNVELTTMFNGHHYKVDWDKKLDTLYTFISKDGNNILFTTARVPTENHNDSYTDINLPDGIRLSISCMFE